MNGSLPTACGVAKTLQVVQGGPPFPRSKRNPSDVSSVVLCKTIQNACLRQQDNWAEHDKAQKSLTARAHCGEIFGGCPELFRAFDGEKEYSRASKPISPVLNLLVRFCRAAYLSLFFSLSCRCSC